MPSKNGRNCVCTRRWFNNFVKRLRFSLRSLVLLTLLAGSAFGLWWKWEPWVATPVDIVFAPIFSKDRSHFVARGTDKSLKIWDAQSVAPTCTITAFNDENTSISFSPDGTRLLLGHPTFAQIWNASSGAKE